MCLILFSSCTKKAEINGEMKVWHNITLTFEGPESSETATPNPFTNYRLNVTFKHGDKTYIVPGYYAADGNAANTSATTGNKWRVNFCPNATGEWNYRVSFRKGTDIAISKKEGKSARYMDNQKGSFNIVNSDKNGRDLRAQGRLKYVGKHYLQFSQSGKYFIKCGVDAPENLLAYYEFDNTPNVGNRLKKWEDHKKDYNKDADSYLWGPKKQKGRNILGAINYLYKKGLNSFSFLTFNIDGDDRNVFPYLIKANLNEYQKYANKKKNNNGWEKYAIHDRFDVSKMDQWEKIFCYGEMKGMFLHFKTEENENDQKMDGGDTGRERKLYYRELIARYSHHLALNWNLGEEYTCTLKQLKEQANYLNQNDPYKNIVVVHTFPNEHEKYYRPLVNENSGVHGFSIQTNKADFSRVHEVVNKWVKASTESGHKIVVAVDEPGDARDALLPDTDNAVHNEARENALWGTLMAGGYGLEWYFGYNHADSDLTCQSWRSRDLFWDQCKIATDFFKNNNLPITEMENMDELTKDNNDYIFAKNGEVYMVFIKKAGTVKLELPDIGYTAIWMNPKTGEKVSVKGETENENVSLKSPFKNDALLYLRK